MSWRELFVSHFSAMTLKMLGIYLLAGAVALAIEALSIGWQGSTARTLLTGRMSTSLRQDLFVWVMDVSTVWLLLGKLLTLGVTFYAAMNLNAFVAGHSQIQFLPRLSFLPAQILAFLLLSDFVAYWLHRTFHRIPGLWMLHRFHHSATELSIFTGRRENPLVAPLFVLVTGLPFALFGSPLMQMPMWVIFFGALHNLLTHSRIASNWGWVGRWLLVSPAGHAVHHSTSGEHANRNFAFMFPILDRVFGTYYNGHVSVAAVGLEDAQSRRGMWAELAQDAKSSLLSVYKRAS